LDQPHDQPAARQKSGMTAAACLRTVSSPARPAGFNDRWPLAGCCPGNGGL